MGGHEGAKKIPTNRQKHWSQQGIFSTMLPANQGFSINAHAARPRQSLAICSTMRLGLMPLLSSLPYWSTLLPVCSALPPPCPNQMS